MHAILRIEECRCSLIWGADDWVPSEELVSMIGTFGDGWIRIIQFMVDGGYVQIQDASDVREMGQMVWDGEFWTWAKVHSHEDGQCDCAPL